MKVPLTHSHLPCRSASKILARQPDLISKSRKDGLTALHIAALNENMDVAKLLIKVRLLFIMQIYFAYPLHIQLNRVDHIQMINVLFSHTSTIFMKPRQPAFSVLWQS